MKDSIKEIVTNQYVLNHLFTLRNKVNREFYKSHKALDPEVILAIKESPYTTQWIKDIVLPGIYQGDEGLDDVLNDIENESNICLSSLKIEIVLNILSSLDEPLTVIKEANEEGEYSLEKNLINYENEKRPFKTVH